MKHQILLTLALSLTQACGAQFHASGSVYPDSSYSAPFLEGVWTVSGPLKTQQFEDMDSGYALSSLYWMFGSHGRALINTYGYRRSPGGVIVVNYNCASYSYDSGTDELWLSDANGKSETILLHSYNNYSADGRAFGTDFSLSKSDARSLADDLALNPLRGSDQDYIDALVDAHCR